MQEPSSLIAPLSALARQAGDAILEIYASAFTVAAKDDNSPVTKADLASEAIILEGLKALTPDIPVISEEAASLGKTAKIEGSAFWLVDPLDGTKEFVKRNGEFTVNIGLIQDGRPVLGVLLAPVPGRLFTGQGDSAMLEEPGRPARPIRCRRPPAGGLVVLSSRSHRDPDSFERFIAPFPIAETRFSGSSLKFALIAAGEADLYPRFGPTMEWDTAAGDAILRAAGGCLTTIDGRDLAYGKPDYRNPNFVAWATSIPGRSDAP